MEVGSYARLEGKNFEFYMTKRRILIGRNSKLGDVDVNMGTSKFVSRRHLEIALLDRNSFYVLCRGKNGVFVDGTFLRHENGRLQLPTKCIIRFPSTQIKLEFQSLLEDTGPLQPMHSPALPLRVDTQLNPSPFVSPCPSPTGTISAVNSCPVSPSSDFHHRVPNFDLRIMAKYATKLLSNQDGNAEANHEESHRPIAAMDSEPNIAAPSHIPPPRTIVIAPDNNAGLHDSAEPEEEVEEEVVGNNAEEIPTNNGEVPNDVMPVSKPEADEKAVEEDGGGADTSADRNLQKPPFSYAQLIVQALLASKDRRQTLSSIYSFISEMYPYYKLEEKGWKNSIRHNLSLNQYFMKAAREKEGLGFGKGGYWCMHPDYEDKLTSQAYVKRKKKGIPVFPAAHLISRSAPPSPTHHPLHSDMTNLKDMSSIDPTKFSLAVSPGNHSKHTAANPHHTQTTTPHFTLPHFFSTQVPQGTAPPPRGGQGAAGSSGGTLGSSSHSLPASPSRPPTGFAATSLKYFPIAPTPMRARASDDLDLLKTQRKVPETIQEAKEESEEVGGDDGMPPPDKRIRLDDQQQQLQGGVATLQGQGGIQLPPGMMAPQLAGPRGPQGVQFAQPGSIQFLPLSLVNPAAAHIPPQGPQGILAAPLSSFLPQSYFAGAPPTMQGVAAAAAVAAAQPNSSQAPPTTVSGAAEMPHRGGSSEG